MSIKNYQIRRCSEIASYKVDRRCVRRDVISGSMRRAFLHPNAPFRRMESISGLRKNLGKGSSHIQPDVYFSSWTIITVRRWIKVSEIMRNSSFLAITRLFCPNNLYRGSLKTIYFFSILQTRPQRIPCIGHRPPYYGSPNVISLYTLGVSTCHFRLSIHHNIKKPGISHDRHCSNLFLKDHHMVG